MYVIKIERNTKRGIVIETLAECNNDEIDFFIATNKSLKFKTPKKASEYFMQSNLIWQSNSRIFIEGPRGGQYIVFSGTRI